MRGERTAGTQETSCSHNSVAFCCPHSSPSFLRKINLRYSNMLCFH
uniref:Uncharacterized protein n=1 Tax=Anguilla anguilla TaxID=7936 RepID=A0A0E9RK03_ANGAN